MNRSRSRIVASALVCALSIAEAHAAERAEPAHRRRPPPPVEIHPEPAPLHPRLGGRLPQSPRFVTAEAPHDQAYRARKAGRIVALEQIVQSLGRRFGGHMLNSRLDAQAGPPVYAVRWLSADGRRLDIQVDAASGRVIDVR